MLLSHKHFGRTAKMVDNALRLRSARFRYNKYPYHTKPKTEGIRSLSRTEVTLSKLKGLLIQRQGTTSHGAKLAERTRLSTNSTEPHTISYHNALDSAR